MLDDARIATLRQELYGRAASQLALLEELVAAALAEDYTRERRELAVIVKGGLALITPAILRELEALPRDLPPVEGFRPAAARLHCALARLLSSTLLEPPEEILDLSPLARARLVTAAPTPEDRRDTERRRAQAEDLAQEAAQWLGRKAYRRALRAYRRAVALDPDRPSLRNDLGLVLARSQRPAEACQEYEEALRLNDVHPERRQEDWVYTHFNLARAQLRLGQELFARRAAEEARASYRLAQRHFRAFAALAPAGDKQREALEQAAFAQEQIEFLERMTRLAAERRPERRPTRATSEVEARPRPVEGQTYALGFPWPPGRALPLPPSR